MQPRQLERRVLGEVVGELLDERREDDGKRDAKRQKHPSQELWLVAGKAQALERRDRDGRRREAKADQTQLKEANNTEQNTTDTNEDSPFLFKPDVDMSEKTVVELTAETVPAASE